MSFVVRGTRNAFRSPIRTVAVVVILGLSISLAITMLLARQAVEARISSVKSSIGNAITISPSGAQGFEGGGEPLTTDAVHKISSTAHVASVVSSLQVRLASTDTSLVSAVEAGSLGRRNASPDGRAFRGSFTPPVSATGTTDVKTIQGAATKLTSGSLIDASGAASEALVGSAVATKNNLSVGSTFLVYGTPVTVKGIFDTGTRFGGNAVILPLATLQRLSSQTGQVTSVSVHTDSITNVAATVAALKSSLGDTADVASAQDTATEALAPLESIKSLTLTSVIGAVVAGAVITFLTMLMIVRERRREIGVFKAIGASNIKIVTGFVSEAMTLTILGSVVGLVAGILVSNAVTQALVRASSTSSGGGMMRPGGGFGRGVIGGAGNALATIQTSIGWDIIAYGLVGAVVIALLGSAIPAYAIAKVRPAEVMRGE